MDKGAASPGAEASVGPYHGAGLAHLPPHKAGFCQSRPVDAGALAGPILRPFGTAPRWPEPAVRPVLAGPQDVPPRAAITAAEEETQPKMPPCAAIIARPTRWNSGK